MIIGNSAFLNSFLSSMLRAGKFNTSGQFTLKVYDGAIPTDIQAQSFVPASFTSQLVGTFSNFTLKVSGSALSVNTFPAGTTASRAANPLTWCALIGFNNIGLILEPGLSGSNGAVILNTLTPALNGALSLADSGIRLAF